MAKPVVFGQSAKQSERVNVREWVVPTLCPRCSSLSLLWFCGAAQPPLKRASLDPRGPRKHFYTQPNVHKTKPSAPGLPNEHQVKCCQKCEKSSCTSGDFSSDRSYLLSSSFSALRWSTDILLSRSATFQLHGSTHRFSQTPQTHDIESLSLKSPHGIQQDRPEHYGAL